MKRSKHTELARFELIATRFTRWVGSPASIILHSIFFFLCFTSTLLGVDFHTMLLFLTTIVSLEAIYLAILIQYTVNKNTEELAEVEKDIGEIQEDIDEMQEDVGEIQKDIDEIQVDVDDIGEGENAEEKRDKEMKVTVERINQTLEALMKDINSLKVKK
jgi:low affinity Fe/Cu permease